MYENARRGLMKDMDKTQLLRMRDEEGMTINEIALRVGCSKGTVQRILGPMAPEQRRARQALGGKRGTDTRYGRTDEGGCTVERKMKSFMPQYEEREPERAVLVMKTIPPAPIPLHGAFMDYTIAADRSAVDVETEQGRTLIQIPMDKLDTFIEELTAIRKNVGADKYGQFWGGDRMTDRAEIERLLNQTGSTLEGLPERYDIIRWNRAANMPGAPLDIICHQSDVIELLAGALRDALDKPMQKPLTERELHALIDTGDDVALYCESKDDDHAYATLFFGGNNIDRDGEMIGNDELVWFQYGIRWRAWASKPTDEEREAAAWES